MNALREPLRKQAQRVMAGRTAAVPSPCMSVCRMDMAKDLCEGCLRTLDEIAAWGRMSDEDRRKVWADIARRIDEEQP